MRKAHAMMMPLMAAMTGLLLQGCIEESTVIKVKRDGSGIIHERSYSAPTEDIISFPWPKAITKAITKGMRVGLFVQVEGEIAKTSAAHKQGKVITLFSADPGKMFEGEGAMETMKRMDHVDRVEFQQLADGIDGLDVDMQDPIRVTFK